MKLDLKKIEKISCIQLNIENAEKIKSDIKETLNSIQSLLKVDLSNEEEFLGFGKGLIMHSDILTNQLPLRDVILKNCSDVKKNMFVVPKVLNKK